MYREPDPDLSQGDIVDGVPHLRLRAPLEIVRRITLRGNRSSWAPFPYPPVEGQTPDAQAPGKSIILEPFHVQQGEHVPVLARFTRAIVLNYDCDLVHEEDHCLVAIVRPLAGVHEDDRPVIRENRNFNYFYLPADDPLGLAEGYADLRQVTCLDPGVIETIGTRKASLTADGVNALMAQFFRFLTRRDLNAAGGAAQAPGPD
jgi:hypothetical protein